MQKSYKVAAKEVLRLRHAADVLQAAVTALDHRKKALENLVYLHGQNYFSEPHARDGDSRETVNAATKRAARNRHRDD